MKYTQGLFTSPANNDRPIPDVRLNTAEYTYPGTIPSRRSAVAFIFMPREKYKTPPKFSATLDGTLVHEGETNAAGVVLSSGKWRNQNPQHILVSVPLETFEKITQAKRTEIKSYRLAGTVRSN
jgi:protoporphyrinogen oxidase